MMLGLNLRMFKLYPVTKLNMLKYVLVGDNR